MAHNGRAGKHIRDEDLIRLVVKGNVVTRAEQMYDICAVLGEDVNYLRSQMFNKNEELDVVLFELLDRFARHREKSSDRSLVRVFMDAFQAAECKGAYKDLLKYKGVDLNGEYIEPNPAVRDWRLDLQRAVVFFTRECPVDANELAKVVSLMGMDSMAGALRNIQRAAAHQGYRELFMDYMMRAIDKHGVDHFPLEVFKAMQSCQTEPTFISFLNREEMAVIRFDSLVTMWSDAKSNSEYSPELHYFAD